MEKQGQEHSDRSGLSGDGCVHRVGPKDFTNQDRTVAHEPEWETHFPPETAAERRSQRRNGKVMTS
jgi:hypothetical protein